MPVNVDALEFYSGLPIDKIVGSGTLNITNDGNTTTSGTNTDYYTAKQVSQSITNPYGKNCFIRFVWGLDSSGAYNSAESKIDYTFTITLTNIPVTTTYYGLKAAVFASIDANNITFYTLNGDHGNVTRLSTDPAIGYTPISHVFNIKWTIYEVLPNVG